MSNYLAHYGRKGMKWYQHIFGDEDPRARYGRKNLKKASSARFDQWGKSPETNVLYVAGYSGSGKSTTSVYIANLDEESRNNKTINNIIHLDQYTDKDNFGNKQQDKEFNKYLDKKVPNWKNIINEPKPGYRFSDEYWKTVDKFANAIDSFGAQQYKTGKKVIVEGIGIANNWLRNGYDHYTDKPLVVLNASARKSMLQADKRDNIETKLSRLMDETGTGWSKESVKQLTTLSNQSGVKKGEKAIKDFLKTYGARRV